MANITSRTEETPAASLLSIDICPQERSQERQSAGRSARLIRAWEAVRGDADHVREDRMDRSALGFLWDECFRVTHCPERQNYIVSPIGHLPEPLKSRIAGPHAMAILIHWINHIATANGDTGEPVVRHGMLDLGSGPTKWELTLVPLANTRTGKTHFLGILGN